MSSAWASLENAQAAFARGSFKCLRVALDGFRGAFDRVTWIWAFTLKIFRNRSSCVYSSS